MLNYRKYDTLMIFGRDAPSADSPKIEGNRRKSTPSVGGNSPKSGDDRIGQVASLRHRGFDWVLAGCRARNRVGLKGGRRRLAIAQF